MAAPAGEEDVRVAGLAHDLQRVLALPLPREAAEQHERRRLLEALPRARVRADQERDPLDLGVAAHVEQHRPARAERLELAPRCRPRSRARRTRPSRAAPRRASGASAPAAPPRRGRSRRKPAGSKPLGAQTTRSGGTPSSSGHPPHRVGREHEQPLAAARPAAQPLGPALGVRPSPRAAPRRSRAASAARCRAGGPTRGTSGKSRSAASLIGVRWCRWRTSASPAPAAASWRRQAATRRS